MFGVGFIIGGILGGALAVLAMCICISGAGPVNQPSVTEAKYNELYETSTAMIADLRAVIVRLRSENEILRADVSRLLDQIETEIMESEKNK